MGKETGISWTDSTWNAIRGCSRVSEGCRNCYAEKVAYRFSGPGRAYEGLVQVAKFDHSIPGLEVKTERRLPLWNGQIKFVENHLLDPLKWKEPRRIFVNSMSDLFHENVTEEMRDKIFAVMVLCPQHTFQILTKRPEQIPPYLNNPNTRRRISALVSDEAWHQSTRVAYNVLNDEAWPLPNVHLGVTVENQKAADDRLDYLCELASIGWRTMVSFEPLLSAVDPGPWWLSLGPKTWAIVGGESGHGARPMHPEWARGLRDKCKYAGVPFFFKQWGEWYPFSTAKLDEFLESHPGLSMSTPTALLKRDGRMVRPYCIEDGPGQEMIRIGTKAAGCLLNGVEHHEFPVVS